MSSVPGREQEDCRKESDQEEPADYRDGSSLDTLVKLIIERTAANEALENVHYDCHDEFAEADKAESEEQKQKRELIMALESSDSFARTHSVVAKLKKGAFMKGEKKSLPMTKEFADFKSYLLGK